MAKLTDFGPPEILAQFGANEALTFADVAVRLGLTDAAHQARYRRMKSLITLMCSAGWLAGLPIEDENDYLDDYFMLSLVGSQVAGLPLAIQALERIASSLETLVYEGGNPKELGRVIRGRKEVGQEMPDSPESPKPDAENECLCSPESPCCACLDRWAADGGRKVTVCAECHRASCWQGVFLCDDAKEAGTVELYVEQLRLLGLENPEFWQEGRTDR